MALSSLFVLSFPFVPMLGDRVGQRTISTGLSFALKNGGINFPGSLLGSGEGSWLALLVSLVLVFEKLSSSEASG